MISATVNGKLGNFTLDAAFHTHHDGITALFGRSGSGKTTILRWIAGLEKNLSGKLIVNGKIWQDDENHIFIPAHKRRVGYVFQDGGLFTHLCVKENLEYSLKRSTDPKISLDEVCHMLGINSLLLRYPQNLSGGEKQRVAIARSLLSSPEVLLLDEPMASLDVQSKTEIIPYIEKLKESTKIPILYISHSTEEVLRLSSQVIKIDNGKVQNTGDPKIILASHLEKQPMELKHKLSIEELKLILEQHGHHVIMTNEKTLQVSV